MKGLMKKIFTLSLGLILISCQNDLPEDSMQNVVKSENESFPIHVVYEGNDYYSQCQLLGDSLVIENKDLRELLDNLFVKNDEVQTYVHSDGSIEYFDNRELFEKKYNLQNLKVVNDVRNIGTRSSDDDLKSSDGYAIVWEDQDYKGWSMPFYEYIDGSSTMDHWDIDRPDNDKISSLKVFTNRISYITVLDCYEDNNYKGKCLTVKAINMLYPECIPNLKKIPRGRKNWGDAISSLRLSILEGGPRPGL